MSVYNQSRLLILKRPSFCLPLTFKRLRSVKEKFCTSKRNATTIFPLIGAPEASQFWSSEVPHLKEGGT